MGSGRNATVVRAVQPISFTRELLVWLCSASPLGSKRRIPKHVAESLMLIHPAQDLHGAVDMLRLIREVRARD